MQTQRGQLNHLSALKSNSSSFSIHTFIPSNLWDESRENRRHTDPFSGVHRIRKMTFFSVSAELYKEEEHENHTSC